MTIDITPARRSSRASIISAPLPDDGERSDVPGLNKHVPVDLTRQQPFMTPAPKIIL